jgi:hypothetical protein
VLLGLFHRTPDNLGLRYAPVSGESLEPLGSDFIQGERGSISHCRHTIISYHCSDGVKVDKKSPGTAPHATSSALSAPKYKSNIGL